MTRRFTGAEFADFLDVVGGGLGAAPDVAARLTAPLLAESVHEQFGHAPPLAALAESTREHHAMVGADPNAPLEITGELRESYVPGVEGNVAGTGSADPRARWHEDGYVGRGGVPVPARPVARLGMIAVEPIARTIWKNIIGRALGKLR